MAGNGLRQGRSQGMDGYTGNLTEFPIDPANTVDIPNGDPVVITGGFVAALAAGAHTGPIAGVFQGYRDAAAEAVIGGNKNPFSPAYPANAGAVNPIAAVALPQSSFFYIKRGAVALTQANVGTRYGINVVAGVNGQSRTELGAASATGALILQRLAPLPGNEWADADAVVEVSVVAQSMTAADAV